jgi:type II secretion system protein N
MSILNKKFLWFTLYGIFITVVFLYLLFPSDLVRSRLEDTVNSPAFTLKMESLRPSLPLGLKLKNISVSSASPLNISFQSDLLDLQFHPWNFLQKHTYLGLSGKTYGGNFDGHVDLTSLSKIYPPIEGKLNFKNIDLARCTLIKNFLDKEITGKASGVWTYISNGKAGGNSSGTIALSLTRVVYPLVEPFLGLNRIEFDHCEIQGQLKNGVLKIEKLQTSGHQINCLFKGEITLADDYKNSQLNLNGTMEISGKNKAKMNVNIGGTLANPISRYI